MDVHGGALARLDVVGEGAGRGRDRAVRRHALPCDGVGDMMGPVSDQRRQLRDQPGGADGEDSDGEGGPLDRGGTGASDGGFGGCGRVVSDVRSETGEVDVGECKRHSWEALAPALEPQRDICWLANGPVGFCVSCEIRE